MIEIYAGNTALRTIREHGFKQELFTSFLGASGGPKWFSLIGLDRYIFTEFFKSRVDELNLMGSSAGAFRIACFAQNHPIEALNRLAKCYSETRYSDKANAFEVTEKAKVLIDILFGEFGRDELITNKIYKAHFVAAHTKGWMQYEHKLSQTLGLAQSFVSNKLNRKHLRRQYQRAVFQSPSSSLEFDDPAKFTTKRIELSQQNIDAALLASGSIPIVMQGVKNINGAAHGTYRDGGIIDYHFDLQILNSGLCLYPHFNAQPKAGWFDKNSSRHPQKSSYDNIVMICPSTEFIAGLPYGKIPDRQDFTNLDADLRIKYWRTVMSETEKTADTLHEWLISDKLFEKVKPFDF